MSTNLRAVRPRLHRLVAGAAASALALVAAPTSAAPVAPDVATPALLAPATFTNAIHLRDATGSATGAAEPSIRVDSLGNVYVTGPVGVPTGGCPFWYVHPDSTNAKGLYYEYRGKFDTDHGGVGGGDCDIATGPPTAGGFDNVAVSSLSLANLTVNKTSDGGRTWQAEANPFGSQVFGLDRQWQAEDPALRVNYLTVHDAATDNVQISASSDGGYTYVSNAPAIPTAPGSCGVVTGCMSLALQDNHFGNIVVNPTSHKLYIPWIAPATAAENLLDQSPTATVFHHHAVYISIGDPCAVSCAAGSVPGPISWTAVRVYLDPVTTHNLDHIFPSIAIDQAGALSIVFTGDTGTAAVSPENHIYMVHSTNGGTTWTAPVRVDQVAGHADMFPWVVAGAAGAIDTVWYQASTAGSGTTCPGGASGPPNDSNGVNNNCFNAWTVQFAQSLDGGATFTQSTASGRMHVGSLCDQGLNCNIFGGNRNLADFFQVAIDPAGAANIAFANDITGTGEVDYARQCTGPSATTGGSVNYGCTFAIATQATAAPPPVCDGANVITDPAGDQVSPTGVTGPTDPNVDITAVSFSQPNATTMRVTLTIASIQGDPIPPPSAATDSYYYVVWTGPDGKLYAASAAEPQPDALAFTYGQFDASNNQFSSTSPPSAATGSITPGTPGMIQIDVPLSGVGNPTIPVAPGAAPAVSNPYALTFGGIGVLGSGLVYTHPWDRAPNLGYGAWWSVCQGASGSSASSGGSQTGSSAGSSAGGTPGLPNTGGGWAARQP